MKLTNAPSRIWKNTWMTVALFLLCIVLVLTISVGATLAAMYSRTGGSASTSVAVFAFDAGNTTNGNLTMDCNNGNTEVSYQFWVTNQKNSKISDVSILYSIQVHLPSVLPSGLTMEIDGVKGTASADGLTYTFTNNNAWYLVNGSSGTNNHTLTFTVDPNAVTKNYTLSGITINVVAEQID